MKNKKGFVFVESIVVLVVVALSLTVLISSYSLVSRKTKEKERYDKASDKYLLYAISNLGTDDTCNYAVSCTSNTDIKLRADVDGDQYKCTGTKVGEIMYDCENVFKEMNIKHLYVVENIMNDLNDLHNDGTPKASGEIKANQFYDNGTIEYMKTLKKCNDVEEEGAYSRKTKCSNPISYMIGVFERGNGDYYYASITLPIPNSVSASIVKNGWSLTNASTPIASQKWLYYRNNTALTGLQYLQDGRNGNDADYYYFDSDGTMKIGWITISGNKYYFLSIDSNNDDMLDGNMLRSVTVPMGGNTYSFNSEGICVSGPCSSASGVASSVDWANHVTYP